MAEFADHAVIPARAAVWDSGDLYPGESFSHGFDVPGTYVYFCRCHEGEEMIGTFEIVEAVD